MTLHPYRTRNCADLHRDNIGATVKLAGWLHAKRDHGEVLFLDMRDESGLAQCVVEAGHPAFAALESARLESVLTVTGQVVARAHETVNPKLKSGEVEVRADSFELLNPAELLPFQVAGDDNAPEDLRLAYRFLDLRRAGLHANIRLRAAVIAELRKLMTSRGFCEIQTPILTASSPEGARDYLVPSRLHAGAFYALPQAPQLFKQLLMVAGFERYFQIAPCFRDEDARADRSPGEFYQLDFEMAFATQEDVFATLEPVLSDVFHSFAGAAKVTRPPFPRFSYRHCLLAFGDDKPDLRNPLRFVDATKVFAASGFALFARAIEKGARVRAVRVQGGGSRQRAWFDRLNAWAQSLGAGGLGYIALSGGTAKGPIASHLEADRMKELRRLTQAGDDDALFFVCAPLATSGTFAAAALKRLGEEMNMLEKNTFRFCWVVDYPMYERDRDSGSVVFSHNPFSMPQGGLEALDGDPLSVKAWQYDIVCNGVELSSGAIRNHRPDIMYKAFALAGYPRKEVERRFGGLLKAFRFGAPPHGGAAPGIDRMVMLLAGEPNIREVTAFPMNQQAKDLLMGAPAPVEEARLRELHIRVRGSQRTGGGGGKRKNRGGRGD